MHYTRIYYSYDYMDYRLVFFNGRSVVGACSVSLGQVCSSVYNWNYNGLLPPQFF